MPKSLHYAVRASSQATPPCSRRSYKWISKEIESLDPEVDYARIWALTATYQVDDMFFNLLYALGMPRITQNPHGSELLVNKTKKAIINKHQRAHDTLSHFWLWYENGPEHIDTQRSLEKINRIHEALGKHSPLAFATDDFIYTASMLGSTPHRLMQDIGLKGFSEKQKIASHRFWRGIIMKMRSPEGYIEGFPESFEAMEQFVEAFEARPWPSCDSGRELAEYTITQFSEAHFPRALQGFGRQILLTLQQPHIRKLHGMAEPHPVAAWFIKRLFFVKGWLAEHVLPDPILSTPERMRAKGLSEQHQVPPMVAPENVPFARDMKTAEPPGKQPAVIASGCPFH